MVAAAAAAMRWLPWIPGLSGAFLRLLGTLEYGGSHAGSGAGAGSGRGAVGGRWTMAEARGRQLAATEEDAMVRGCWLLSNPDLLGGGLFLLSHFAAGIRRPHWRLGL